MAKRKNTKMETIRKIFMELIDRRKEMGDTEFRQAVIERGIKATGSNKNSVATMYQLIKKAAVEAGEIEDFGRTARGTAGGRPKKVPIPENARWMRVNEKGRPVAYYTSRAKARADKSHPGTTVARYVA